MQVGQILISNSIEFSLFNYHLRIRIWKLFHMYSTSKYRKCIFKCYDIEKEEKSFSQQERLILIKFIILK